MPLLHRNRIFLACLLCAIPFCLFVGLARADNWPQWRGPHYDGISAEKNLPVRWSRTENVAWRLPLPGPAGATPCIWGDRIFLTSADETDLVLLCASTKGQILWKKAMGTGNKVARGDEGNFASPSPSTDGSHVWAFFGSGDLGCYDFEGNEVWKFNVQDRYGKFQIQFGMSSTPLLDGDRLYLQLIHGDRDPKTQEALVVALDKKSGAEIWKQGRPSEAYNENEHSYASPTLYRDGKREFLLSHGADYIVAHSLSDGHELWRSGGLHPEKYDSTLRLVSSPLAIPGLIVAPSAKRGRLLALRPEGEGNITDVKEFRLWSYSRTPDVPSPLCFDGLVYLCGADGSLACLDAKTGEAYYEQQRIHSQRHRSSPVYGDGKIYLTARDGMVSVVKAGKEFELLAQNQIDDDISASPAISDGRIYLRGFEALWAIGPAE